jgi:MFS-type transporter involved in bile tolerance (Atg22 family)
MARLTLSYGAAQIIAPALTGVLAQASGSFKSGLWLTTWVLCAGLALLALLPRDP